MWRCTICGSKGPGDVADFHRHYMRDHYESKSDADRNRYGGPRPKPETLREMRNRSGFKVQSSSSEAERDGWDEGSSDQLACEYPPALW